MRLFLAALLFTFNAFAVSWLELEEGNSYKLTQSFQLPQKERSGSLLDFLKGQEVELEEVVVLSMIKVTLFVFDYKHCPGPQMTTDMEIIPVQRTNPVVEVGAELEANCKLNIFIEDHDLYSQSMFE